MGLMTNKEKKINNNIFYNNIIYISYYYKLFKASYIGASKIKTEI